MAPPDQHPRKLQVDTKPATKVFPAPTNSYIDGIRDEDGYENTGGSEHAATPPMDIGSGVPSRQRSPRNSPRDEDDAGGLQARHMNEDALSTTSGSFNKEPLRARGSSISFDPSVTTDSGDQLPLRGTTSAEETPTREERRESLAVEHNPSFARASGQSRASTSGSDDADTQEGTGGANGRGTHHAPRTDIVRKIIMGTDTGLSQDSEYLDPSKMASLTSTTTTATLEEARTPLEPVSEYFASPLNTAAPFPFPSSESKDTPTRRESRRNQGSRQPSQRRVSRRSSARSNGISPASSFLSGFGRASAMDDPTIALQDPDADGKEFGDDKQYVIGREIGSGGFSVIKEVHTWEDGVLVVRAVKIVRKKIEGKSEVESDKINSDYDREVYVWKYLHHPYILPLIEVYETDFATFSVMKYVQGGTLFDLLRSQRSQSRMKASSSTTSVRSNQSTIATDLVKPPRQGLRPALVKRYIYQIASALRYLHEDVRVVHRDVKLENCLLNVPAKDVEEKGGDVLLCDFGLADFITNEGRASPEPFDPDEAAASMSDSMSITVAAGSLLYAAPELINAKSQIYSAAVDVWAFGVCAYALIAGEMPFSNPMPAKIIEAIQTCTYDVELLRTSQAALDAPEDAVTLIRSCLEPDPAMRWTIADVLECDFLEGCKALYEPKPDYRSAWS